MVQFSLADQRNNCDLNLCHNLFELWTEAVELSKNILVGVKYFCIQNDKVCVWTVVDFPKCLRMIFPSYTVKSTKNYKHTLLQPFYHC